MRESHQRLAPEHLLKALMDDGEGLAANLITTSVAMPPLCVRLLMRRSQRLPQVTGDAGQVYMDNATGKVLAEAEKLAEKGGRQLCAGRAVVDGAGDGEIQSQRCVGRR